MQSPEEIEARVEMLTSPEALPEQPVSDPTRRQTEIYMKGDDLKEHIKLRDDADSNLRQIEKIRQEETERTNEAKPAEKVNELIAANAATQPGGNGCDGSRQHEHKNSTRAAPTAASETE